MRLPILAALFLALASPAAGQDDSPTASPSPSPTAETATATSSESTETTTRTIFFPSVHSSFVASSTATGTGSTSTRTTTTATSQGTATISAIPVANTMGLIMPNPKKDIYANVSYTFGFVEPGPRPGQIMSGWVRQLTPALVLPNYTVGMFPVQGSTDPTSQKALANPGDWVCGAPTVYNYAYTYGFKFDKPGYHMFVINNTWAKATLKEGRCAEPLQSMKSFFATQVFSVQPYPTNGNNPGSPAEDYTTWTPVSTKEPGPLPMETSPVTRGQKLAVGLGVGMAFLVLIILIVGMWWLKRRRFWKAERFAFSRLRPFEQDSFLRSNPYSKLNPNRPTGMARYFPGLAEEEKPLPPIPPYQDPYVQQMPPMDYTPVMPPPGVAHNGVPPPGAEPSPNGPGWRWPPGSQQPYYFVSQPSTLASVQRPMGPRPLNQ